MKSDSEYKATGLGVSPGIAIGPAFVIEQSGLTVPEYDIAPDQVADEVRRFQDALAKTQRQLGQLRQKAIHLPAGAEDIALLLDAYRGMLSSGSRLVRGVEDVIAKQRLNAEAAIQRQITALKAGFSAMNDAYLAARAADVGEVGGRLIRNLLQQRYNPFAEAPAGCVILAEEITPADTAQMEPERVAGLASVLGGAEGHAAIMARSLGLPAVMGVADLMRGVVAGNMVILDGRDGTVIVRPTPATLQHYRQEQAKLQRDNRKLKALRDTPAATLDGAAITLHANVELPRDLEAALDAGATGIGLLRTEFMYMNRADLPGEDEQYEAFHQLMQRLEGRPLTVRTLDVGGEKLATALGDIGGGSPNPALGLRAIRLGLRRVDLLDAQLGAILRAAMHGPVRILLPMISSVFQVKQVRERMQQVERRLHKRGLKLKSLPPLGAMIEIPAAALAADALARVCDFFAIGSNDLTQYTLAIDRGDEQVADLYDPFHPAVLRLIEFTTAAAWRANIPVSMCGELAGDPRATGLLLGLGLRELSMSPYRLPPVKQRILHLAMPDCVNLAKSVLAEGDEVKIRSLLEEARG
jgi:phosphotransferase system enzyme I (PtsI)